MDEKRTDSGLFRQKSLDRVSSPEKLNDYIRVTTPSVWLALAAVLVMLAGMIVWSVFGTIPAHAADGSVKNIHPISYIMN